MFILLGHYYHETDWNHLGVLGDDGKIILKHVSNTDSYILQNVEL